MLDIDGCITDGKNKKIDLKSMVKLQEIINETLPIKTVLCTGRSASYVEAISQMLHISDWCICENGAYIYHPINDDLLINPIITSSKINELNKIKIKILSDKEIKEKSRLEIGKDFIISLNPIGIDIEDLFQIIKKNKYSDDIFVSHSTTAVDITPKGVNKGSILDLWCATTKSQHNQILGVGDSVGDMYFLEKCGFVACPNNASQNIKMLSNFVSEESSTLGLIDIYTNLHSLLSI